MSQSITTSTTQAILTALQKGECSPGIAADYLEQHGGDHWTALELIILRSGLPFDLSAKGFRPHLECGDVEGAGQEFGGGWINCSWGGKPIGGCWIHTAASAREENDRCGWHRTQYEVSEGEVSAYKGCDMTGGLFPDAAYFRGEFGLDLTDEQAEELVTWLQEASERVCQPVADDAREEARLDAVREEFRAADGSWTGCDWAQPFAWEYRYHADADDMDTTDLEGSIDADGLDGDEDAEEMVAEEMPDTEGMDEEQIEELRAAIRAAVESALEYASQCSSDATAAQELAAGALEAAEAGSWAEALELADEACRIESTYGDCPTWRAFRDAIREAADS